MYAIQYIGILVYVYMIYRVLTVPYFTVRGHTLQRQHPCICILVRGSPSAVRLYQLATTYHHSSYSRLCTDYCRQILANRTIK